MRLDLHLFLLYSSLTRPGQNIMRSQFVAQSVTKDKERGQLRYVLPCLPI